MADFDPRMLAAALQARPAFNFDAAEDAQRWRGNDMLEYRAFGRRNLNDRRADALADMPPGRAVVPRAGAPASAPIPFMRPDGTIDTQEAMRQYQRDLEYGTPGHANSPFRLQDEMDPSQRPVFHGLGTDRMIIDPDDVGNPLRGAAPYRPTPQIREYQPNMSKRWWENV